jgi:hypothetical protein
MIAAAVAAMAMTAVITKSAVHMAKPPLVMAPSRAARERAAGVFVPGAR